MIGVAVEGRGAGEHRYHVRGGMAGAVRRHHGSLALGQVRPGGHRAPQPGQFALRARVDARHQDRERPGDHALDRPRGSAGPRVTVPVQQPRRPLERGGLARGHREGDRADDDPLAVREPLGRPEHCNDRASAVGLLRRRRRRQVIGGDVDVSLVVRPIHRQPLVRGVSRADDQHPRPGPAGRGGGQDHRDVGGFQQVADDPQRCRHLDPRQPGDRGVLRHRDPAGAGRQVVHLHQVLTRPGLDRAAREHEQVILTPEVRVDRAPHRGRVHRH